MVTQSDLARIGGTTVAEVLRQAVPLDVIEYPGLLTGISIRGFRPEFTGINPRTLVLQNGRAAGTTLKAMNISLNPNGRRRDANASTTSGITRGNYLLPPRETARVSREP